MSSPPILGLEKKGTDPAWYRLVTKEYTNRVTVAIVSKYGIEDVYISIKEALKHAGRSLSTEVKIAWLDAERYERCQLKDYDGILIPGGFGKRGIEGKIEAITVCPREQYPVPRALPRVPAGDRRICPAQVRDSGCDERGVRRGLARDRPPPGAGRAQRTGRHDAAWGLHRRYPGRHPCDETLRARSRSSNATGTGTR